MSIMMVDVGTSEERMVELERKVSMLLKQLKKEIMKLHLSRIH